jgi:hypothetical protein
MKKISRISRRGFFKKSAVGIGSLGVGTSLPAKLIFMAKKSKLSEKSMVERCI